VVELKAVSGIADLHMAQALSYLKASRFELALILNFGEPRLRWKESSNPKQWRLAADDADDADIWVIRVICG
jgi:hypothetical protein